MSIYPIATQVLPSAASTVTFSSIPSTYRDLELSANFVLSANSQVAVRCNGDTGSVYTRINMSAQTNSGAVSSQTTSNQTQLLPLTQSFKTTMGIVQLYFADYQQTNKFKVILNRSGATVGSLDEVVLGSLSFARTNAINQISIFTLSAGVNFTAGSVFNLYGIEA